MKQTYVFAIASLLLVSQVSAYGDATNNEASHVFEICPAEKQLEVSEKLEALIRADHTERGTVIGADMGKRGAQVYKNDKARRLEVAAYFAEGCINSGKDYYYASIIFQHGEHPDHYLLAYMFATKALQAGEKYARGMIPVAVDRYLMNSGFKQLFGTQAHIDLPPGGTPVMCTWPVESTFADTDRDRFGAGNLSDIIGRNVLSFSAVIGEDTEVPFCDADAKTPPKGIFPNLW